MAELDIDSQRLTTVLPPTETSPFPAPAEETTFQGPAEPTRRKPRALLRWVGGVGPVGLAVLGVLVFFAGAFGARHIRVPVGPDSFFYVESLRITARYGLGMAHLLARPAFPLVATEMGQLFGVGPWTTAVSVTLAMTGMLGMAGAAVFARWRVRGWALALSVLLIGASGTAARLLAGKSENLMNVWLLAALLAVAVWGRGRRGFVAATGLAFAAGLAEWPFLAAFVLILLVTLAAWELVPWSPRVRDRSALRATGADSAGARWWSREADDHLGLRGLVLATLAGAALVLLVVRVWNGTGLSDAVKLAPLPPSQYLIALGNTLNLGWPLLTTVLFLAGWWVARRFRNPSAEPVRWVLTVWAALAILTILVGMTGVPFPAFRALTFDLPISLGVAAAVFLPWTSARGATGLRRAGLSAGAAALAVFALLPAFSTWYQNIWVPTRPNQLGEILAAWNYSVGLGGRTVILVVDRDNPINTLALQREVVAATGLAGGQHILVVVGHAEDILQGRVPTWGNPGYDALSRSLFPPILAAHKAGAPVLVGKAFDRPAFDSAVSRHRPVVGSELAVLRGPPPRPKTSAPPAFFPLPHWWNLAGFAALIVLVFWLCGAGWCGVAIPDAPAAVRAALAPAFGAVSLTMTTLIITRSVHQLEGAESLAALSIALVASMAAAVVGRAARARSSIDA
jgi:hypothetical protein